MWKETAVNNGEVDSAKSKGYDEALSEKKINEEAVKDALKEIRI